ncbi:uncharacterized protein LOC143059158 isoform X2 [Mytilus galloprovincialis]|uniref:uncharacterized protein LOC143059158 isoform X2 n=1 Tax=Mytilus galloprovincialis TaxID=29158 RepID=UPI003F7B62F8
MVKAEPGCDIYQMFNVTKDNCQKSSWLCFKFKFLPPHLMNHVIASLCRKYEFAEVDVQEERKKNSKRVISLFRGTAVFELKKTSKLTKLLITTCPNLILVQVLEFGKSAFLERGVYKDIADFVANEINKIISIRFKMTNVKFEKKWECGLTKPESVIGSNDFSTQEIIHYCETCCTTHKFRDEWSDLQSQALCRLQGFGGSSETNSKTETTSKNLNVSTKVRVNIKCEMGEFLNVSEAPTRYGYLTGFNNERINFAKMGIIVLNNLTDVLYDLLKQDKPNIRPRKDCDVTYLYREHRIYNMHIPSNGWGGTWQRIMSTDIAVGDDIERIRLTRNELQHSRIFMLNDTRFAELCNIINDLLERFDHHNKPTRLYTDQLNQILAKTISLEEVKAVEDELIGMSLK